MASPLLIRVIVAAFVRLILVCTLSLHIFHKCRGLAYINYSPPCVF